MSGPVSLLGGLAILGYVSTQGYFEEGRHLAHNPQTLSSIPKQFEIRDYSPSNAVKEFEKYAQQIHYFAKQDNVTVLYKIQVELMKRFNTKGSKKNNKRKLKIKRYKIPLKKKSMKLSNFEVFLRKTAEENSHYPPLGGLSNYHLTTEEPIYITTKVPHLKFKPIKSKLRNFSKIIRPVKNNIITLS